GTDASASDADEVVPKAVVRPQSFVDADGVGAWWIASDRDELAIGHELPADHVLGVGGATRTLAELVVPVAVDRALDLGTGCGIQALLVARHAREVIATDVSARALAFGELNARLNGVSNVSFRQGSMFEPVVGEQFDLVVSNPPFVITPRVDGVTAYEYRDGGLIGDALVEQFVREVPAYLTPGGIAQLLGNWESLASTGSVSDARAEESGPAAEPARAGLGPGPAAEPVEVSGLARLESWIAPDLDAWVVEREELTPLSYAELWIRDGGTTPRDAEFDRMLAAWLDDFAQRRVAAIGFGYVLLRRPVSPDALRMRRFEQVSQPLSAPGRAFHAGLVAHDAVAGGLPPVLVTASDVTEARHFMPGDDDPSVIELRQGGGFGRTVSVDPALAGLVGACDGELTVSQIVAALAELFEVPLAELWADLEPRVRQLVIDGFLTIPAR
uniref:methyltransferase n=1 Tax=Microbacterium sp. TaxID=51671 RepID=UPI0026128AE3